MTAFPTSLRQWKFGTIVLVALALWITSIQAVVHHHHDDFKPHSDCALCKVATTTAALPDTPEKAPCAAPLVGSVACPIAQGHALAPRLLRLRAPSTSPPCIGLLT
ncbi:hypothetical protein KJ612_06930 [Myxococcota bacterium]|jgi:hypothetical protein|nr:hypothetical protein [Myxococcota bacterium]MBU1410531.1 hypothetical protein [Myxococcota bacterium]PKN23712.1 MAG: hypothetical protein CVU65_13800 [Deltaproteobacteria bacterium HGW-Deltaproteobacteria-22]